MGLFDKFKKKNVESANKKTETTVETKPDDTFECTLDHLYGELANTIISTIPMEWEEFHYLGEVESGKCSWSSVFFVKRSQDEKYIKCFDLDGFNGQCSDAIDSVLLKIYDCFVQNNHKAWEQMCISVKNTGDFKVNFKYDVMAKAEYGQVEREIIWAYETFGGRPHNSPFLESILERYLAKKNG
jgi:hypothetical protein